MKTFQEFLAEAKQPEIEMHGMEVDEMDFGSIGKTLSKYGKGVPKEDPKKVSRSTVHTDYTMTGHKEKKSGTGRVYTKILSDYDDDAHKAAKATQAPDQVEAPKRGRGRPAGALNKNGSGVTGKGWSDEAKASMKAKLAANKAAKLAAAAKNESEAIDEAIPSPYAPNRHPDAGRRVNSITNFYKKAGSTTMSAAKFVATHGKEEAMKHHDALRAEAAQNDSESYNASTSNHLKLAKSLKRAVDKSTNESEEIDEAADAKQLQADYDGYMKAHARTGDAKYKTAANQVKSKMVNLGLHGALKTAKATPSKRFESVEITEEDWADITEGQSLDAVIEFMMDEEYQSLDELSKATLGSYIKKSSKSAQGIATDAMHLKNVSTQARADRDGDRAEEYAYHSYNATNKQLKRQKGLEKATDRLTKESVELEEVKKDSFGIPSHHIDKVKQKIRDGIWEPQTDLKANAHVEIRHTKTGKRETIHVRESEELEELSKKTLKSYYAKASNSFRKAYNKAQDSRDKSYMHRLSGASTETKKYKALKDKESEARATMLKRNSGTIAAGTRLGKFTNESMELEEANGKPVVSHAGSFSTQDRDGNQYQLDTYKVSDGTHRYNLHNPKTGNSHSASATIKTGNNEEAARTLKAVVIHAGKGDHKTALDKLNSNSYHKWTYHGKNESVEESADPMAAAAYAEGKRHGTQGAGNNTSRAQKEWGEHFPHYNKGFLHGKNQKAKLDKAFDQKPANESIELDEAKTHKPGSVGIAVNPGGSDLGKAGKKYTVFFHPEANSPRGRTKAVDISHHEDVESAKAAKAAYVEKHKAHGVVALRGMGESTDPMQKYLAGLTGNLIVE